MTDIPHLAYPFQWDGSKRARELEQDTVDEVGNCCVVILKCPLGSRSELPEFGYEDPTFSTRTVSPEDLTTVLQKWEPRADIGVVSALVGNLSESNATIRVQAREGLPDSGF